VRVGRCSVLRPRPRRVARAQPQRCPRLCLRPGATLLPCAQAIRAIKEEEERRRHSSSASAAPALAADAAAAASEPAGATEAPPASEPAAAAASASGASTSPARAPAAEAELRAVASCPLAAFCALARRRLAEAAPGAAALYAGLAPAAVETVSSTVVYFYLYSLLKQGALGLQRRRGGSGSEFGVGAALLVAALAGAGNMLVTTPAQVGLEGGGRAAWQRRRGSTPVLEFAGQRASRRPVPSPAPRPLATLPLSTPPPVPHHHPPPRW
jgi:hypothetical protein